MTLTETESFIGLVVAGVGVGGGGLGGEEEDVTGRSFYKADRI